MGSERNLIIAVDPARHGEGQVIENAFAEAVHVGQPVCGREIDARLPFFRAVIPAIVRRYPNVH